LARFPDNQLVKPHQEYNIWFGNCSTVPEMWRFYKFEVRGKSLAVSHAVRHQLKTPQQQQESKQQQGSQQETQERQL
jgi:hypothetical protein